MNLEVAWLLIGAPVLEEAVFRAGLQEQLLRRGWSGGRANALASAVFGASHALARTPLLGLAVVPPSLVLGLLYSRTRRLWPCVALHAAMNATWLGVSALGPG